VLREVEALELGLVVHAELAEDCAQEPTMHKLGS
jgi:hypothetical protein